MLSLVLREPWGLRCGDEAGSSRPSSTDPEPAVVRCVCTAASTLTEQVMLSLLRLS